MSITGSENSNAGGRVRLGMVGGGQGAFIGDVHRMAARLDDRYDLVAGALSSDPQRAADSAAQIGIDAERSYASFEEMAKAEAAREDGIEVVSIVTPNHMHFPVAKAFIEAGIHVICDKPLTSNLADAQALTALVKQSGLIFAVTYNYSGYAMVRQAREMIANGELGSIRVIQVEYPQDWLSTKIEDDDEAKQAHWRTDPARAGGGGCIGDIGTHAFHLAGFVSQLKATEVLADLHSFVPGRQLDDNAHMLLRYENGAKGMLWSSQVAAGNENALRLRIYGDKAGLEWSQEDPNYLQFMPLGKSKRTITRGGPDAGPAAAHVTRIPPGHPEAFLEAFANLYRDVATRIVNRREGKSDADLDSNVLLVPDVDAGLKGIEFVENALLSNQAGNVWKKF